MEQAAPAFLPCLSDFIDLSNLTHQHFHLDFTDMLFIVVAVAKSTDLTARNSQRENITETEEHDYYCYTDKYTVS